MARTPEDDFGGQTGGASGNQPQVIAAEGQDVIGLPNAEFVKNADILRDGQDLVLEAADGSVVVIEGYFNADPAPLLQAPNGEALTPQLVESFVHHAGETQYAQKGTLADESPVGAIQEVSGKATITRTDGSTETVTIGTPVFEGDVIETEGDGAVNIVFIDETSLAVSENAKLAIDEYVFDPASESGSTDVSVLRGLFVFTSGLIGRDDPDDVNIDTPMGSIGIRGTVIVGNVNTGEITVMEGAIVMRGFNGTEITLAQQFETGRFNPGTGEVLYLGKVDPVAFGNNFNSLKSVSPGFFNAIDDAAKEDSQGDNNDESSSNADTDSDASGAAAGEGTEGEATTGGEQTESSDADGATGEPTAEPVSETTGEEATAEPVTEPSSEPVTETFTDTTFGGTDSGFDTSAGTTSTGTISTSSLSSTTATGTTATPVTSTSGTTNTGTTQTTNTTPPPATNTTTPPPTNDFAPVFGNGGATFAVNENSAAGTAVGTVAVSDADGNPITYTITSGNPGGVFSIDSTGAITVNGTLDFEMTSTYTLIVSASDGVHTVNDTYTVNVGDANDAPTTTPVTLTAIAEDSATITITQAQLLANAADADLDTLTATNLAINTGGGTLTDNGNGTWDYTPDPDDDTGVTFSYDIDDGVATVAASASLDFTPANDAPTTTPVTLTAIAEDSATITITQAQLLANAADTDLDTLTATNLAINTGGGTLTDNGNGTWDYTPDPDDDTGVTFSYDIDDGVATVAASASLDFTPANDAPTTTSETVTTAEDTTVVLTLADFGTYADAEGTAIAGIEITDLPAQGDLQYDTTGAGGWVTVTINQQISAADVTAGRLRFVPDANENGASYATIGFEVSDGTDFSTGGYTLTIDVNGVNDAPVVDLDANDSSGATGNNFDVDWTEGTPVAVADSDLSLTDSESANLASATITLTNPQDGTLEKIYLNASATTAATTAGITVSGDGTHSITLTGSATIADYLSVLRNIMFNNESDTPNTTARSITVTVSDGTTSSAAATATISITPVDDNDVHTGTAGADTLQGDAGNDTLDGGAGDDTLMGGDGDDTFRGGAGDDYLDGGEAGETNGDTADYTAAGSGIHIDLAGGVFNDGDGGSDTLIDIENVVGSAWNDTLGGNTDANRLDGGAGDDTLLGSVGNDTLIGGTGSDTVDYSSLDNTNNVVIDLNSGGSATTAGTITDTLTGVENIIGTQGNDDIDGASVDTGANVIDGNYGNDILTGGDGDTLIGGEGDDQLNLNVSPSGAFSAQGDAGIDTFIITSSSLNMAADGNAMQVSGGTGGGDDTLAFNLSGASIAITADGTEDRIDGIEIFDFQEGSAHTISIDLENFMINNNDSGQLTIRLDDSDTLNLDFSALSGSWFTGTSGATWIEYTDGTSTVRVESASVAPGVTVSGLVSAGLMLNSISGSEGFRITDNIGEGFGYSIAALGDVNNDGYDDIAFTKASNPDVFDGRVFVLNGRSTAFSSDILPNFGMTTHNDLLISAAPENNMVIASGGDFNGDGQMDYIVGSINAESGGGTTSGNIQVVDGNTGAVLLQLDGMASNDMVGQSVAFVGDLNGDGYDDVVAGAPNTNAGSGAAYVIFGGDVAGLTTLNINSFGMPVHEGNYAPAAVNNIDVEHAFTTAGEYVIALGSDGVIRFNNVTDMQAPTSFNLTSANITGMPGYAGGPLDGTIVDIMVKGPYMYVLTANNSNTMGQVTVLEIRGANNSPTNLTLVDTFEHANLTTATALDMVEGKLVVATNNGGSLGGFMWLDVSPGGDILAPHGTDLTLETSLQGAKDVAIMGNYAYVVTTAGGGGIRVIDVGGGSAVLGTGEPLSGAEAAYVDPTEGYLYVVTTGGGLVIYDIISDPAGLSINWNFTNAALNGATDVTVDDGIAYVSTADGVMMVDVRDPGAITLMGNIDPAVTTDNNALSLTIGENGVLYVGSTGGNINSYDLEPEGFVINGANMTGQEVSSAGDFNDDGFGDFLVTMPGTDTVALVLGGPEGLPDINLGDPSTFIEIGGIADIDDDIPVFSMGDVNGDGVSDIAVASDNEVHVFFGYDMAAPGDALNASTSDLAITAAAGFEIVGFGTVGDFNGDGFDDGVVAMRDLSGSGDMVSIYVVYGGATMPTLLDNATAGAGLDDANNAFKMTYQIPSAGTWNDPTAFEFELTSGGDLNGDGFADLVVGLPNLDIDDDGDQDGEAIVVYGRDDLGVVTQDATPADADGLTAVSAGESLVGGLGADTLNDGGNSSVTMIGGAGDDIIEITNMGFQRIDGGGGLDKIVLSGSNSVLDFTNVGGERISDIEGVTMNGTNTTVVLGLNDIFDMMKSSPDNIARITSADASNTFVIELPEWDEATGILTDNNWTTHSPTEAGLYDFDVGVEASNVSYQSFGFGAYQLWISDALLSGRVIIGSNVVTDGDGADANATADSIQASDSYQTLVGNDAANVFHDGAFNGASMFGLGGNDTFILSNDTIGAINGGGGAFHDKLQLDAGIDFRMFESRDIANVEEIEMNFTGQNVTLSMKDLIALAETSDNGGYFLIDGAGMGGTLVIDVAGAGGGAGASRSMTQLAADMGGGWVHQSSGVADANSANTVETFYNSGLNLTIAIDSTLFSGSNVETI